MCGIAGLYLFSENKTSLNPSVLTESLKHRGPDNQNYFELKNCFLFHARLSVLDLSKKSNQPFLNENKSKALCYNGEIFNYKELSGGLSNLITSGDAEVLFKLFEAENITCLNKLNGFFAFSFYDSESGELTLVRDRYGVKPLYYYADKEKIAFASELKPLMNLIEPQEINPNTLNTYLRLNYCSGRETIFKNVFRLLPGQYLKIKNKELTISNWYQLPKLNTEPGNISGLLNEAVKIRLNADVPVGSFLSGGLDSSLISAIAKQHQSNIHTFSLGFADEPFFDETHFAELVAHHIKSEHHVFKLKNNDLLENIQPFLNSIDEPFADSSAFNVFVLSKYTKQHVKVALSGDGADELFMGYNKHKAELMSQNLFYKNILPLFSPVLNLFPQSRNSSFSNSLRQLKRFSKSVGLKPEDRYTNWACISDSQEVKELLHLHYTKKTFAELFSESFSQNTFNAVNYADLKIVLADDMLVKADRMSMRHGLEIRNPFLDYRVVEMAMNLPMNYKISGSGQKLILKENFKHLLPAQIFNRPKKGFELPLWKWLNKELRNDIEEKWLNKKTIEEQQIFNYPAVEKLKKELFSTNPADSPAKVWALIVFQNWYNNFEEFIKK